MLIKFILDVLATSEAARANIIFIFGTQNMGLRFIEGRASARHGLKFSIGLYLGINNFLIKSIIINFLAYLE